MRGSDLQTDRMFCYSSPETFVPPDHPLRPIHAMVEKALSDLHSEFAAMYSHTGRPSVPPEKLLKALLLQAFYSIRSIRLLMEQIQHDILFRWFVGLSLEDDVWDPSTFSQNQERLLASDVAKKFFEKVLAQARSALTLRLSCGHPRILPGEPSASACCSPAQSSNNIALSITYSNTNAINDLLFSRIN